MAPILFLFLGILASGLALTLPTAKTSFIDIKLNVDPGKTLKELGIGINNDEKDNEAKALKAIQDYFLINSTTDGSLTIYTNSEVDATIFAFRPYLDGLKVKPGPLEKEFQDLLRGYGNYLGEPSSSGPSGGSGNSKGGLKALYQRLENSYDDFSGYDEEDLWDLVQVFFLNDTNDGSIFIYTNLGYNVTFEGVGGSNSNDDLFSKFLANIFPDIIYLVNVLAGQLPSNGIGSMLCSRSHLMLSDDVVQDGKHTKPRDTGSQVVLPDTPIGIWRQVFKLEGESYPAKDASILKTIQDYLSKNTDDGTFTIQTSSGFNITIPRSDVPMSASDSLLKQYEDAVKKFRESEPKSSGPTERPKERGLKALYLRLQNTYEDYYTDEEASEDFNTEYLTFILFNTIYIGGVLEGRSDSSSGIFLGIPPFNRRLRTSFR